MAIDIIRQAEDLNPVPFSAACEYSDNRELLVGEVNRSLTASLDIKTLIGQNPLLVMYDNHKNHAAFMSNVFKMNDFAMMTKIVLWAYRTYSLRGFSFDYFPRAMKAWIDAIKLKLDPSRAEHLILVYQWIIDNHEVIIAASRLSTGPPQFIDTRWVNLKEQFLASLLEGNHQLSIQLAAENIQSARDLSDFYLEVIQRSMHDIGFLWEKGEISVAREHLASAIVTRVMASLYPRFIVLEQTKGKALVTAAPNEFHEIGPRMVADLLEIDGWDVDYTGANLPAQDLRDILLEKEPFLLAISVGMPFNIDRTEDIVKMIRSEKKLRKMKIMIGGHCISQNPKIKNSIGVDGGGDSAREAVLLAAEWWENAG